ncbi:MAG TPA: hypothetical protein VGK19_03860 [Capsulimonadaceae bacterium]|jgi:hypothetical protein
MTPDTFTTAHWIGSTWMRDARPVGGCPLAFRKDWTVTAAHGAQIRICGWPKYALYVNGAAIGYGPARSFAADVHYDTWDLAGHVQLGRNSIAVILLPFAGVTGYAPVTRLGLIAEASTAAGDIVGTDATWKARNATWFSDDPMLISLPVGSQEHYDINSEPAGWKTDEPGDGWENVFVLGPVGTAPWRNFSARPIPLLAEAPASPPLVWRGTGPEEAVAIRDNIATAFNSSTVTGGPCNDSHGWVDANGGDIVTYDLGRTRLIRAGVDIDSTTGDIRIETFYANGLGDRPTADRGFQTPQEGGADSFTPSTDGPSSWRALVPRGFRFLTVRVAGTGSCRMRLAASTVDYPFPPKRPFTTADPLLARIWDVSADTLRSATNDTHVDTCSRENVLWTFDACVAGEAAYHTFGETAMWRRCLLLVGQGIDDGGDPKAVVPAEVSFMNLIDQTLSWVVACRSYCTLSGDNTLAAEVAEAAARLLAMCERNITVDGYFLPPSYSWHWVDWAPIDKRAYSLPVNALVVLAASAARDLAKLAGDGTLLALATRIHDALAPRLASFYDDTVGAFRCHIDPATPPGVEARTMSGGDVVTYGIHTNSLAVAAGVGTPDQRRRAMDHIAANLTWPVPEEAKFGPGWTHLLLDPLFDHGHGDTVIEFMKQLYGQTLAVGAPTWAEGFGPAKHNTAHGWGAAVNTLLATRVGGVMGIDYD